VTGDIRKPRYLKIKNQYYLNCISLQLAFLPIMTNFDISTAPGFILPWCKTDALFK